MPMISLTTLCILWRDFFSDVMCEENGDDMTLSVPFLHFGVGTPREYIWHWFEGQNEKFIVGEVIYGNLPCGDDELWLGTQGVTPCWADFKAMRIIPVLEPGGRGLNAREIRENYNDVSYSLFGERVADGELVYLHHFTAMSEALMVSEEAVRYVSEAEEDGDDDYNRFESVGYMTEEDYKAGNVSMTCDGHGSVFAAKDSLSTTFGQGCVVAEIREVPDGTVIETIRREDFNG